MYKYEISVIIPVYNCEKYIERCIKSVLNQTIQEDKYEIILVDDASTDSTYKFLEKYKNISKVDNLTFKF